MTAAKLNAAGVLHVSELRAGTIRHTSLVVVVNQEHLGTWIAPTVRTDSWGGSFCPTDSEGMRALLFQQLLPRLGA